MRNHTGMNNKRKGIGPHSLGSPLKQTSKEYRDMMKKFPNFNRETDTIMRGSSNNTKGATLSNESSTRRALRNKLIESGKANDRKFFKDENGNYQLLTTHTKTPTKQTRKYKKMFKERYPNRDMSTDTMYVAKGRNIRDVSKKLPGFDRAGKKTGGRVVATKIAKKD